MKKVLLAEDDTDFATVLKHYLEIHQFEVHWTKDGEEAWQVFQKKNIRLVYFRCHDA